MQRIVAVAALCAGFLVAAAGSVQAVADPAVRGLQSAEEDRAETVEINTATAAELRTLPGVGERIAERIIEYREEHGGFEKTEDLMNVRGIGENTYLRLRPLVRVDAPADK